MTDYHPALADAELANNDSRAVTINGSKVLICRAAGELYAVENRCTHQEAELEGGRIRGCFISCPLHGVRFDLRDGKILLRHGTLRMPRQHDRPTHGTATSIMSSTTRTS